MDADNSIVDTQNFWKKAFGCLPLQVIIADKQLNKILFANTPALKELGYEIETLLTISPGEVSGFFGNEENLQQLHQSKEGIVLNFIRKDGTSFNALTTVCNFDSDGRVVNMLTLQQQHPEHKIEINDKNKELGLNSVPQVERRYKIFADNGSDGILIHTEAGDIVYYSASCEVVLGYTSAEALQINAFKLIHPNDIDYVKTQLASVLKAPGNTKRNIVYRLMHKNGGWRWLQSNISNQLSDPSIGGIVNSFIDISAIKIKENQLSTIADNLNGVVFRYKLNADGSDEMLYVSKGAIDIWDVDAEMIMQDNGLIWKTIDERDLGEVNKSIQKSAETLEVWNTTWRMKDPQGKTKWLRGIGNPQKMPNDVIVWDSLIIDITNVKETQEQHAFQAKLLNTIGQAVIATDMHGHIVYWNHAATNLYGWTEQEAMGENIISLTPSHQTREQALQLMEEIKQGHTWAGEFLVQRKDGTDFMAYVTDAAIVDQEGNLTGIIGISNDISEQKRTEREMSLLLNNTEEAFVLLNKQLELVTFNSRFQFLYRHYFNRTINVGTSIFNYAQPERIPVLKKVYKSVLEGNHEETRITLIDKTGNKRRFSLRYTPATEDQKDFIIGVFVTMSDITDKENAEEARLAEQKNKEALINTTDDIVWSVDNQYKLVTANNAFVNSMYASTGIKVQQGDYLMLEDKFSPEWLQYWQKLYDRAFAGESFTEEIYTAPAGNNPENWSEIVFKPIVNKEQVIGIACYSRDVTQRKHIEKQQADILVQQQLFSAIVQSSEDAILSKNLDGVITSWNNGAQKMFGFTTEEALGRSTSIITPIELAEERIKILSDIRAGFFVKNLETERITKLGNRIKIASNISPIFNAEGHVIGASEIIRDITSLKQKEDEIKRSEQRYRTLFEQSIAGIYETTLEGTIINCNDAFALMLKYNSASDLIGKGVDQLYFEHNERSNFIKTLQVQRQIQNNEGVLKCKDGSALYYIESVTLKHDEATRISKLNGIILDITERMHVEKALHDSNDLFYYVSKATSDVVWDWDLKTNAISRSPENMMKLFGYAPADHINNFDFWKSKMHPEDIASISVLFEKKFADASEHFMDSEYRFMRADNSYANVYDKGYIIRSQNGEPIRMIGAVQDISKIKESEVLLQKRAAELETSNLELEQFAFVASHDLQEPLRMITSFLTQLKKYYQDTLDTKGNMFIDFAVDGAHRMRQIILDLLEYSRVGRNEGKEQKVDLNVIVDDLKVLYHKKILDTNAVITAGNLPVIQAYKSPLGQLFQNLLSNALTYIRKDVTPLIHIWSEDKNTHWQFGFSDNGIGIEEEYLEKIFIIFQRLHSRDEYAGTGLGLAIAKKIVESFEGKIWVTSKENEGSIFYFTLKKK